MKFFLLTIFYIVINSIHSFELEASVPCVGKGGDSEYVLNYCHQINGTMVQRCCRAPDNATFVAIDLIDANLTEVPDFSYYTTFELVIIDLRLNFELIPSYETDFVGLTTLDELILPVHIECPGGERAWDIVNVTIDLPGHHCQHPKDICANATDLCNEKISVCNANGPDHFLCLCKSGYHGYKCLRYGKFPYLAFFLPTALATIITSVFLFWKQRRHVKKKN